MNEDSNWAALLNLALPALDHVFGKTHPPNKANWTLGGGTALMLQLNHRLSNDIDIFVPGTRLKAFTPHENPASKLISPHFQWPGHYLKFERPEGEIDFLSPPLQTDPGYNWRDYKGRQIAVETPDEVIIKKIRYRSQSFTARDAFDMAAVAIIRPNLAEIIARETPDALPRLSASLQHLRSRDPDLLHHAIIPLKGFKSLPEALEDAFLITERASQIASELQKASKGEPASPRESSIKVGIGPNPQKLRRLRNQKDDDLGR
jgi:hypothetical protein